MKRSSLFINVSPTIGEVSAEAVIPTGAKCIVTLAHGAGAGMNHSFMVALADALSEEKVGTLRFNFPFTEQKKGRPDVPAVAHKTIEGAILKAHELGKSLPVYAAGKSFGGRMSSQYISLNPTADVKGLIFYGFPLHAPGKASIERAAHLKDIKIPMLFLQGTRDQLANIDMIEEVCSSLPTATLVKIEGGDHSFKAGKKDTMKILVEETVGWIGL